MAQDDVLDQADALMRRHRSFVARPVGATGNAPSGDDAEPSDIPVLTEVVDAEPIAPRNIDALLDTLRNEVDTALESWLVEVLPAAVASASQQILAELDSKARQSLLPRLEALIDTHRDTEA